MSGERYELLVQRLLDRELTGAEADELAAELRENPSRRRETRQQLVAWELWSQHCAPERSAAAFVAAVETRLRAELQTDTFVAKVRARVGSAASGANPEKSRVWPRNPFGLVWAGLTAVVAVALVLLIMPRHAHATVVLRGETVCTRCMLHETHEHSPAIRVRAADGTETYYVSSDPNQLLALGDYCVAAVPVVATGAVEVRDGRRVISVQRAERPPEASSRPPREPVLFPF